METGPESAVSCGLCERALPPDPVETEDGHAFCCEGCRDIYETVGFDDNRAELLSTLEQSEQEQSGGRDAGNANANESATSTFLRVDGLNTATGEAFLESVANSQEGVVDAEASYVTETIRIGYDPNLVCPAELCDTLSIVGYTAYLREDETDETSVTKSTTRPSRGKHERGLDDTLGFRYAAGVLFGAFLMLPYVSLLYPAHLSALLNSGIFGQFSGGITFGGSGGLLVVRLYFVLTGVVLFFTGKPLLRGAYISLKMRRPNTDLLVSLTVVGAFLYSSVAAVVGRSDVYYDLAIVVTAVVVAVIFYESLVKRRAMDLLADLTLSQVGEARLYEVDGTTRTVAVDELETGDHVLVQQGERIPVDGVLTEGTCIVDESVITGESLPVEKRADDDVIGGSVVTDNAAVLSVGDGARSRIDDIVTTVWNIQSAEHGVQRRANELAGFIVPLVLLVAILVVVGNLVLGGTVVASTLLALLVLLAACPWALGLATPLSVATSIREAMDRGIVIFDETVFERLRDVDVVVFDKTGTLTTGEMEVLEVDAPDEVLRAATLLERRASHPVANAIVSAFGEESSEDSSGLTDGGVADNSDEQAPTDVSSFESHANGIQGVVDGTDVLVGNLECFAERGWPVSDEIEERTSEARGVGQLPVVVGQNGRAAGLIVVGDEPREGWKKTLTRIGENGTDIVVLTGDDAAAADGFGQHPYVEHVFAGVPPEGKTAAIDGLQADSTVAMIGDGTNDAPALALADLGITLGSGTAVASDASDIAIVDDDLSAVEETFHLASAARRRVRENNALAFAFNAIAIPLAVVGLLNPLTAMVAVIVTGGLLAGNSSRTLVD